MYLQIDVIRLILLNVEVEALIRFQCVCKEWRSTIQHPDFKLSYRGPRRVLAAAASDSKLTFTSITNNNSPRIKTLFQVSENHSFLDTFRPLVRLWSGVWCSCNGLVLFSMGKHILLWNPSTRCCTKVLELSLRTDRDRYVFSGLCYVSSTGDYKAVLLLGSRYYAPLWVASLKNKEWLKMPFPYLPHSSIDDGINFRNTLHLRAICRYTRREMIIVFEVESDEFKELELPTPELHGGGKRAILGLGIMDGCLCMANKGEERREELQVWVMKEYGVKESWVCQFVISAPASELFNFGFSATTLYPSKCNTKVLICSCYCGSWEIFVYDVKNNKPDNHFSEESKYCGDAAAICSYVQSFVSPHEFIWKDDQHKSSENDVVLRFILEMFNI
ncbi:F-box/kelch-repeat protein At3g23880-like [Ipomoea triloba]|uniref:F-box/kelch-repeat protein At3g23880-like n=1 Tax=Ipomoea triloba TaxID=35885 RepID=UPI00125DAC0D|nr:F-box/kelch-repeat protein At3g23880-like [Ipomoea triloba]